MDVHLPQREVDLMNLSPFEQGTDSEVFEILREHDPLHWNDEPLITILNQTQSLRCIRV